MIGVIGIVISLALLMYLAYRGITVLLLAPILAMFAAAFSGMDLIASYTHIFMPNLANYLKTYMPIFMLGAIFGKIMEDSGSAKAIAHAIAEKLGKNQAILAVVLSCAILTYGGVSLFVVAFAVYPIGAHLFKEAGVPKRLLPGAIAFGSFTFTMTALPGTPAIQNAIPMAFFKTTIFAAPVLGIISSIIMFVLGTLWLQGRAKSAMAKGEGYGEHPQESVKQFDTKNLPSLLIALVPIILVLVLNFILTNYVYTAFVAGKSSAFVTNVATWFKDKPFLGDYNGTRGNWTLLMALTVGIIVAILINLKRFAKLLDTVNQGTLGSMLPILNTASETGYGNVVKSLAAFAIVQSALLSLSDNPLITSALATTVLAGITGSASGGMSIALGAMGQTFYDQAIAKGIDPQVLHRVVAIACGGLDSLPHNGAVVTLLGITQLNHKSSYADIGMCTVVIPVITCIIAIILGSMGIV